MTNHHQFWNVVKAIVADGLEFRELRKAIAIAIAIAIAFIPYLAVVTKHHILFEYEFIAFCTHCATHISKIENNMTANAEAKTMC